MSAINTADGQARIAAAENAGSDYQKPFSATAQSMSRMWGGGWGAGGYYGNSSNRPLNGWDHNSVFTARDPAILTMAVVAFIGYLVSVALLIVGGILLSIPLIIVGAVILFVVVVCTIAIRHRRIYDNKEAAAEGYGQPTAQGGAAPANPV